MKTLVLNVDRDDDFGRKAKIKSPIIGIRDNIDAANKIGEADPEDSDLNAIFSAISTYKTLVNEKKEAEIATICGHMNVGVKSDEIITKQLEEVIKVTNADDIILVTDGAEDEYILPIIQSRVKITSINRVTVKQSRELEDTYYRLMKILSDEKVQKQFFLPVALVFIVWAFFVLMDMAASGFGATLLVLGTYMLVRIFRWERNLATMWDEVKLGFLTGRLSVYTSIIGVVILIAQVIMAYDNVMKTSFVSDVPILPILFFIDKMIFGIVIAGLVMVAGRAVDVYLRDKKSPVNYWIAPFSIFAFGFVSLAVVEALYKALINWPTKFDINPFLTISFLGYTSTGIMIALVGAITYHYVKEIYMTEEKNLEVEKQTTKIIKEN